MEKKGLCCVASPLQAICAYEAINEYNISISKFVVVDDGQRLDQIENFLKPLGISYSVMEYKGDLWSVFCEFFQSINPFRGYYDFLFLGNYLSFSLKNILLPYVKCGGKVVYLDDGSSTISIINNSIPYSFPMRVRCIWTKFLMAVRLISDNNFFTLYADDIKKKEYCIRKNNLKYLLRSLPSKENSYVIIIGTAIDVYCNYLGIAVEKYFSIIKKVFRKISIDHKDVQIVYIPHGRDTRKEIIPICEEYGFEYVRINECIELFSIKNGKPCCVYGFSSSALKTLHVIFPEVPIFNILLLGGSNIAGMEEYEHLAAVYRNDSINTLYFDE